MIASLIRRTVVPDQAYAAVDIDSPGAAVIAVAWRAVDGWRVGVDTGRTVAAKLSKTVALNRMHVEASHHLDLAATRGLLGALR